MPLRVAANNKDETHIRGINNVDKTSIRDWFFSSGDEVIRIALPTIPITNEISMFRRTRFFLFVIISGVGGSIMKSSLRTNNGATTRK
jgi:hypothetical protein